MRISRMLPLFRWEKIRRLDAVLAAFLLAVATGGVGASCAWAGTSGPGWELTAHTLPTYLLPNGNGTIVVDVFNVGAGASHGAVTVTDTLPPGVRALEAGGLLSLDSVRLSQGLAEIGHEQWACTGNAPGNAVAGATVVTCSSVFAEFEGGGGAPTGDIGLPNLQPKVAIVVEAGGAASGLTNRVTIAGGGAPAPASTQDPITISSTQPPFGFVGWDGWFSNADGSLDTQAGSHPYEATFSFDLATALVRNKAGEVTEASIAGGEPRDIEVRLPPGLVINPSALPQCNREQLAAETCPTASQVGYIATYFDSGQVFGGRLFNMVAPPGVAGEIGFNFEGIRALLDGGVRSGSDYGITAHVNQTPQRGVQSVVVMLWSVPGEASHDRWRNGVNGGCTSGNLQSGLAGCQPPENPVSKSFLTLPSACGKPASTVIRADTWHSVSVTSAAVYELHDPSGNPSEITGCEHLSFGPLLATELDTARADTPAGLTVDVKPSLGGLEEPTGLGTSDIQDATVTLPEGFVVNPGQAAGLQACGAAEDGLTTQAEKEKGEENNGPARCPGASKIGTARIKTPLLEGAAEKELEGNVYVLQSNPPDIQVLIAASADGVNIKQVGTVHLNESTGQVTSTFKNVPQQPVSDIRLSFTGGSRGALITPRACGIFTTTSDFTPWSSPFISDETPSAQLALSEGAGGGPCPAGEPFAPVMVAGSVNSQAGGFAAFSTTFSRQDPEQDARSVSVTLPPGLLAAIRSVERCPEPQASLGTCGQGSLIGHVTTAVGAGPDPLYVQGRVYFTGPYGGAPFGLSVVVPAVAGPFNLGNVVVRAAIHIDPHTAQPTIVSDPLPRILDGVPLQIKLANINIDREGFTFNPTNCAPLAVAGSLTSVQGVVAAVSSPFQAVNCTTLGFHPVFSVSTQAKTSKQNGASLTVKTTYPAAGPQANIRSVAVVLPKQLPARLTTIQQACPEAVFAVNPATCPVGSMIGMGTATTPILAAPFMGPAYLVSHGGAAFPDVVIVFQAEGVTFDLVGNVNIKHGITSSDFATVPDAPIGAFQLTLPEGRHSGLAAVVPAKAKGSMCGQKLTMPFTITGQNGAVLKQDVKIAVTGCPKPKKAHRPAKHAKGKKRVKRKKG
jgi:hypothetical protein